MTGCLDNHLDGPFIYQDKSGRRSGQELEVIPGIGYL